MGPVNRLTVPIVLGLLAACGQEPDAPVDPQRFSLDEARHVPAEPLSSPDTQGAGWTADGQAIRFGRPGAPLLSLACDLQAEPVQVRVVRHVRARPGLKALFPVIGNGRISRFSVDAALHEGEWRWEGALPASDPMLDVFVGTGELEATLPGGGSLVVAGSGIPGEFVDWCRAGGRGQRAEPATNETPEPDSARPEPGEG